MRGAGRRCVGEGWVGKELGARVRSVSYRKEDAVLSAGRARPVL